MGRLVLTVEASDLVVALLAEGLKGSKQVTVVPERIFPGYVVDVVEYSTTEDEPRGVWVSGQWIAEPGSARSGNS